MLINEVLNIKISDAIFRIRLMEDSMGSSRVVIRSFAGKKEPVSSPNYDDSGWE